MRPIDYTGSGLNAAQASNGNAYTKDGVTTVPGVSTTNADGSPASPVVTPAPAAATDTTNSSGYAPRYTDPAPVDDTTPAPQTEDQIQAKMTADAQDEINGLNSYQSSLLSEQKVINDKNDRSTNAISTLTGLAGSTEADQQQQKTTSAGQAANEAIKSQVATKVQGVLSSIRTAAVAEARAQRNDYRTSEQDRIAARATASANALTSLKNISASGVTFDGLKTSDPTSFAYLSKQFGGDAALKGAFLLNTPKDQIIDSKLENGKYIVARMNPITNKVTVDTLDTGLPSSYTKTIDAGDRILAVPDGWDGDPSKLISINKGLDPKDAAAAGGGDDSQLYNGLSTKTATAIRAKTAAFKTEPVVTNFNVVQEGKNFADSLKGDTKNPADDQALIYALAKALDPGSVVREGEYATAKKYSQSWVNSFGGDVNQAIDGTGFLSDAARTNIKATINSRYLASKKSYDNVYGQYKSNIDSLTGRADGSKFLTDYTTQANDNSSDGGDNSDAPDQMIVGDKVYNRQADGTYE